MGGLAVRSPRAEADFPAKTGDVAGDRGKGAPAFGVIHELEQTSGPCLFFPALQNDAEALSGNIC